MHTNASGKSVSLTRCKAISLGIYGSVTDNPGIHSDSHHEPCLVIFDHRAELLGRLSLASKEDKLLGCSLASQRPDLISTSLYGCATKSRISWTDSHLANLPFHSRPWKIWLSGIHRGGFQLSSQHLLRHSDSASVTDFPQSFAIHC
jgi:hypothetical protein